MASTLKHLRSSTENKRPTASGLADGQIAINTASGTPAMFFKDNAGNVVKVGPVHVGASAPNTSPAGSTGNSTGELWVNNSLTTPGLNYYSGSAFVNLTPSGTTSAPGLVELATPAETQTGTDGIRAVTPSGLQSKVSDSTSTTSSTTIASATAVKSAYDLANAALPKSGGTVTGQLLIGTSGSLVFEGSINDNFETTLAVVNPTADRTITFPNTTGSVITTGDSGTVTSTMIADGTIVNADINASAAIAPSKLGSGALPSGVTVASANIVNGTIVDADVNASAAIAGTKISPDFGGQDVVTTGNVTGAALIPSSSVVPTNGVYLPSANNVAISTNGTGRLFVDSSGNVGIGTTSPATNLHVAAATPIITIEDTSGATADIESTCLVRNNDAFEVQLRSAANVFKATAYRTEFDSSGISSHQWRIDNSEKVRIDASGRLLVGTSSALSNVYVAASAVTPQLQVEGNSGSTSTISITRQTGAAANLVLQRGVTGTPVSANNPVGQINFNGFDGTNYRNTAQIKSEVDGTPGTGDMPGRLVFSTTADGAATPTERMRIKNDGTINFSNVAVYADNAAATSGGLAVGDVYRTSTGQLMIRY